MNIRGHSLKYFLVVLMLTSVIFAGEWPQWRGADRNGHWQEDGIVQDFNGAPIPVLWRIPLSRGYSGPTVAKDRVYVMDRIKDPNQFERVFCFNAKTGKENWSYSYPCKYKIAYPAGPRASVTVDGKRAYSLGAMGHFYCFDAETGDVVWNKDLKAEYDIKIPTWGIACSPLIENDRVIVQIAGKDSACVVAFDKRTGKEIWRALDDPVNYSSPITIDQAGKRVIVVWTVNRVAGLDPATGQVLWQQPFSAKMGIVTPVLYKNYIFVSSFFDGSLLLKLNGQQMGADIVWQRKGENEQTTDSLHCCISTPVILDDHIYGVDSYGELRCLELLTGNRVWENHDAVPHNRWANIHMVQNNDNIWMFNESGELIISRLLPDGYSEVCRSKIIDPTGNELAQRGGVCWSHPAFAYKNIYVRNDKELVCLSLAADSKRIDSQALQRKSQLYNRQNGFITQFNPKHLFD